MKQDLKFFTDRVGFNVYRQSTKLACGTITVANENHAQELYQSQDSDCMYFISAKLRIIMQYIQLKFDGRTIKDTDQMAILRKIERFNMVLENPEEMPTTYQEMYFDILNKRNGLQL
jgi:hypothetical protein